MIFVCAKCMWLTKETLKPSKVYIAVPPLAGSEDTLFMDFIIQRNVVFPNVWLVRREVFFKAHPTKKIYSSRQGQNWQMILPLAYNFKCGYINEPLVYYVFRKDSHSHNKKIRKSKRNAIWSS